MTKNQASYDRRARQRLADLDIVARIEAASSGRTGGLSTADQVRGGLSIKLPRRLSIQRRSVDNPTPKVFRDLALRSSARRQQTDGGVLAGRL